MAESLEIGENTGILLLSATEVAEKICKEDITAETVLHEYTKRIEVANPAVNAVVAKRFEVSFHYIL